MSILSSLLRTIFANRAMHAGQRSYAVDAMTRGWTALRAGSIRDAESAAAAVLAAGKIGAELKTDAYYLRAQARGKLGNLQGALEDYTSALQITPGSVENLLGRGGVLHELNQFEDALAVAEAILELDARNAVAHNNRGLMLRELARHDEAEAALRCALECDNAFHDARANLALILIEKGRLQEAELELSSVLAADPAHVEAHRNRAIVNLLRGDFAAGWRDYASRLEGDAVRSRRPYRYPEWDGSNLGTGTLLIYGEQGLGDDILFASCYQDAIARVGQCVIECEPRLEQLFKRSFPRARVVGSKFQPTPDWLGGEPGVSVQISAGSLPGLFRNRLEEFPVHRGYLKADPDEVAGWRARLDGLGSGLKVGISWAGGTPKTRRGTRSIPLNEWLPILSAADVRFVSLQYGDCDLEISDFAACSGVQVHHWPETIADYDKTAALVCALDLVISVTTSVIHLAGALGQQVWVLVPANPEWRYLSHGSTMPWYPSARLFRQAKIGDWSDVIHDVSVALENCQ